MDQTLSVFFTGIVGVFAGMTLLYVTVRLNAFVAGAIEARWGPKGEPETPEKPKDGQP